MNKVFFSLKRAHQSTLRFSRLILSNEGLTPARYDLLHALKRRRTGGVSQGQLHRVLGVTRATVSRMLGSLEDLGFVRREVDPRDRRRKDVWLTDEGFARLEAAYQQIVRPGWLQLALCMTLGTRGNPRMPPPRYCHRETFELDGHLWSLRRGFADTGSLSYRNKPPG